MRQEWFRRTRDRGLTLPDMKKTKRRTAPNKPRCILVPVDFSEPSLLALDYARALAQQHKAHLLLAHVVEPLHADLLMDSRPAQRAARTFAHERLTRLWEATKKSWPRTGHELREGHPVATIIALARRSNADLIVMGTHGQTGLQRAMMGSVAERVARMAPCSVLVVR